MLKRMILINSANFQFADIDLSKEIFFVGDNASGKTTSTRALHFLYNGDGQKLGIPRSKDSFNKHYFSHDDSYIIYVFETFFIFTYSRSNTIKRWFSKQEFELESVIKDGELLEFAEIEKYIKSASLKVKPKSIEEYTSILYGGDRKFADFAIAKIENYKIFLEVFNMIFNIDKAIVTASDIKKAIQKSLDRKDETLTIDYEDFIRKLNDFRAWYHFFQIFDANREHLKNALILRDALFVLEEERALKLEEISYRYEFEIGAFQTQKEKTNTLVEKIKRYKEKIKRVESLYEAYEIRVSSKRDKLQKELVKLEALREKFDPLEVQENTLLANKYEGVKKDLDSKKYSLQKLQEKQTSARKEKENQIEQIEYKINYTIVNETNQTIYKLSEIEKSHHEMELLEIEKEYRALKDEKTQRLRTIEQAIDAFKDEKNSIEIKILDEQNGAKSAHTHRVKQLETQKKSSLNALDTQDREMRKLKLKKDELKEKDAQHDAKYEKLTKRNAELLASKRAAFNAKIVNARAILHPIKNSLQEFFSEEIDGWEEDIYPLIDKDLLVKSCDELEPQIVDAKVAIGFTLNTSTLKRIETQDEAIATIERTKKERAEYLSNFKDVHKSSVAKLDEEKNELVAQRESCELEIQNSIDESSSLRAQLEKIEIKINDEYSAHKQELETIEAKYKKEKEQIELKIKENQTQIESLKSHIKELDKEQRDASSKSAQKRDFNIDLNKKQETQKANQAIKKEREKIAALKKDLDALDEEEMIEVLKREVESLEKASMAAYDAVKFLQEYEEIKESLLELPSKEMLLSHYEKIFHERKALVKKINIVSQEKVTALNDEKISLEARGKKYEQGIKKVQEQNIELAEQKLQTQEYLSDLVDRYEDLLREYRNQKSKFRELIDRLKRLETHSIIELNFNMENFAEAKSISELENILDGLHELSSFEKNKYESQKKRSHNNFDSFLRNTIPSKLQSFDDLESEFEKAKTSINRSLSQADFGVIRDIKLITDSSKSRNDSIASLLQDLSKKVYDTVGLYSNKSLFYFDISKSVNNIEDIQTILEEIKKRGANGPVNLFDTIDLSISYIENGKKVENKLNIKDESSSGGNILLKVAIAMSILSRYAKKTPSQTPFFLIIDEVSKLQSKNQDLIRKYINDNGFKTLFITPDPAYPDPKRALYYTFKNIQEEGDTLEIRQMNII